MAFSLPTDYPDPEPRAPNKYSQHELLRCVAEVLDGAGSQVLKVEKCEFYSNLRIALMSVSCLVALTGQFYAKFPADTRLIVACVAGYFAMSALVMYLDIYALASTALVVKDKKVYVPPQRNARVFLEVSMPDLGSDTLQISARTAWYSPLHKWGKEPQGGLSSSLKKAVGAYFHEDGYLAVETFMADVDQVLKEVMEKKKK